jgi:hypothetical protein
MTERKSWSCPKERKAYYAKAYQVRMSKEDSPQGERWRQKRREEARRSRAKKAAKREEAKRIAAMASRIAQDNATRRAQATVKAEARKADNDAHRRAEKASRVDAMASLPVAKIERQTVDEWMAAGNQVERLPSQLGMAYAGLGRGLAMPLY